MSYAQVKVSFGDMVWPNQYYGYSFEFTLKSKEEYPPNGLYATLIGYPSGDPLARNEGNFSMYTSAFSTASSYREKLIAAYGLIGLNVSPVMASTNPNRPYYITIDFNYYVGEEIALFDGEFNGAPIDMSVTQEEIIYFEVLKATVSAGASCDLANFTLTLSEGGTPPYTVGRYLGSEVLAYDSLSFDFSRSDPARDIVITDANGDFARYTLPFARSRVGDVVFKQIAKPGGTDVRAIIQDDGKGAPLVWEYAVDDPANRQSSNYFELLTPGPHLFYFWDNLGCEFSVGVEVDGFQHIDVRAVHNPINFLFERSTGDPYLLIRLKVNDEDKGMFRANPYQAKNGSIQYIFAADEIARQHMPSFDDYFSNLESPGVVQNMFATVELQLLSEANKWETQTAFVAVNAARQIGLEGEKLNDILNNREPSYIFVHGQPGYIYWVDEGIFYREKLFLTADTVVERGGKEKKIKVLPYCEGDIILKYLDRNGMYRFYRFTKNYERTVDTKEIGAIEHSFASLSTGQGYQKSIGNKSADKIKARAEKVPVEDLNILKDIYTSPRVYFHLGAVGHDNLSDWVLVKVKGDGIAKLPKRNFIDVEIEIELPANNEITML